MENLTLLFGGDLYLDQTKYSVSSPLQLLFKNCTYRFLNLEAPLLKNINVATPAPKVGPSLYQLENTVLFCKELGVGYVSGANNHLMDYGLVGMRKTKEILNQAHIKIGGVGENIVEAGAPIFINESISILSVCEEEFGVAGNKNGGVCSMYSKSVLNEITRLKQSGKIVIIYAHGGGEGIPLPSNYIINRFHEFIQQGADMVVAHHPHVPQGYEQFNGKYIFYSLGNFIHSFSKHNWGMILKVVINNKDIVDFKPYFVEVKNNEIFLPENQKKYFDYLYLINSLSERPADAVSLHQEQAVYMYESYYRDYFRSLFRFSFKRELFMFFKKIMQPHITQHETEKEHHDERLLLHLIRNNSHKEFIEIALKIKTGEVKDERNHSSKELFKKLINFIDNCSSMPSFDYRSKYD
jgi:poly-gamma-glutamate synthesis protein (capsule biosynthesis protein)